MMANEKPTKNQKPIPPATPRNKEPAIPKQIKKTICPPKCCNVNQQSKPALSSADSKKPGSSQESRKSKILHVLTTPSKFEGWNRKVPQPAPMDMWDQAKLNKIRHPIPKQNIQQPRITIQPGSRQISKIEAKVTEPKNFRTFKSNFKSGNQPKVNTPNQLTAKFGRSAVPPEKLQTFNVAKNETGGEIRKFIGEEQKPPSGTRPHNDLRQGKVETRVVGAGATASNIGTNDTSEMTELVKLLVKLTDENMKLKQNLQAFSDDEQKMELPPLPHVDTKMKGVASANDKDNDGSLDITPLVKLLVKLTDEHRIQKNANVKTNLKLDQTVGDDRVIYKDANPQIEIDPDEHSDSPCNAVQGTQVWTSWDSPVHGHDNAPNLIDDAEDIDRNERREQKKAELKERFFAGVEDSNLRKQFNYLLKQEDLNEIIDQMLMNE